MLLSSFDSSLMASSTLPGPGLDLAWRSGGQAQSRHSRRQSPHRGFVSSHFFLRRLHMMQPVCTLRILALGISPTWASSPVPTAFRGRHGRLRRRHLAHGKLPSQACLICAQRWQTGRLSEPILNTVYPNALLESADECVVGRFKRILPPEKYVASRNRQSSDSRATRLFSLQTPQARGKRRWLSGITMMMCTWGSGVEAMEEGDLT